MIREEYNYFDLEDYLDQNINLVIMGINRIEERAHFFENKWMTSEKYILKIGKYEETDKKVTIMILKNGNVIQNERVDLIDRLPRVLKFLSLEEKVVLMDLSSLDNVCIMFLTKVLLVDNKPKDLFSAYIRPKSYRVNKEDGFSVELSSRYKAVNGVPGFARRESGEQVLCAFIGFEGFRLNAVLETIQKVKKIIPIVAFPSGSLDWYNTSIWNAMDILQNETDNLMVNKCLSASLFDAIELLNELIKEDDKLVLAPLGTRVHSLACAIYATQNKKNARIVYDFVTEMENRAIGISEIVVYHMASFFN